MGSGMTLGNPDGCARRLAVVDLRVGNVSTDT
jgi:hypothetical protein